jgi:hypothetical protein
VVEEHAEEAAFLVLQRQHLDRTGQATWARLEAIEDRLDAHLDGLLVAGDLGRRWLGALPAWGGAAAYLGLRLAAGDGPDAALARVDPAWDAPDEAAAVAALTHSATGGPNGWAGPLAAALGGADGIRVRVAARVAGRTRLPLGANLVRALARGGSPETQRALVEALGRLRYPPARSTLRARYLGDADLGRAAARALVRLGDPAGLAWFTDRASSEPGAPLAVATAGGAGDGRALAELTRQSGTRAAAVLALGVHGDAGHVDALLDALDDVPESAALGLRVLTGAALEEDAWVPDGPSAVDGEGGGDVVRRPARDAARWRSWWAERRGAFAPGARYRSGRPFAPLHVVTGAPGGLADDLLPSGLRDALAAELAGRYGVDAPFEATAYVRRQRLALSALAAAVAQAAARLPPAGAWDAGR